MAWSFWKGRPNPPEILLGMKRDRHHPFLFWLTRRYVNKTGVFWRRCGGLRAPFHMTSRGRQRTMAGR
jgi:hypothetical protein